MNRIALVAQLKPGAGKQASVLLEHEPPFDPAERGFARHAVYLSAGEVVFVFDGDEVGWIVEEIVNEPFGAVAGGARDVAGARGGSATDRAARLHLGERRGLVPPRRPDHDPERHMGRSAQTSDAAVRSGVGLLGPAPARSYKKASSSPAGQYPASTLIGASSTSNQWVVPLGMCTKSPSASVNARSSTWTTGLPCST
jgi:hypothetical protein